jgi:hypothetical protein
MMKIAAFSTKPYDREFLASANDSVHELRFFEPRLTVRDSESKNYRHSGSLEHRSMSKAYNAIVDTTPTTIKYSILFTSYLFFAKDVTSCSLARRGVTQLGQG